MNRFQIEQKQKLQNKRTINYQEIIDILGAFQIASGQEFAIGKTTAFLDYLKNGNSINIENFNFSGENKKVFNIEQLVDVYKKIDQYIDLSKDKSFESYF